MFSKVLAATIVLLLTANIEGVFGIRFLIDGKECFSHKAEYGATVQFSFVVIIVEDTDDWHYTVYGTDLVVKGPNGEQIQEFHDKTSESSEFVAHNGGLYRFCFSNHSPYPEFVDVNVHSSLFYNHVEHAKHVNERRSKRAMHKALVESFAMIGASVLQVYLLQCLFERKLGISRV